MRVSGRKKQEVYQNMNSEHCKDCDNRWNCDEKKVFYNTDYCRKHAMKIIKYDYQEDVALFPDEYAGKPLKVWKFPRD